MPSVSLMNSRGPLRSRMVATSICLCLSFRPRCTVRRSSRSWSQDGSAVNMRLRLAFAAVISSSRQGRRFGHRTAPAFCLIRQVARPVPPMRQAHDFALPKVSHPPRVLCALSNTRRQLAPRRCRHAARLVIDALCRPRAPGHRAAGSRPDRCRRFDHGSGPLGVARAAGALPAPRSLDVANKMELGLAKRNPTSINASGYDLSGLNGHEQGLRSVAQSARPDPARGAYPPDTGTGYARHTTSR